MQEPIRGTRFLLFMHEKMLASPMLIKVVPVISDIFVFTYPIYLVALYLYGIIRKKIEYKIGALFIFLSTALVTGLNIFIQFFFDKQRPNIVLGLDDQKIETVLHKFLPSSSFPSDHAAVSFAIATSTLAYGIYTKNTFYKYIAIVFYAFAIIMCISRITTGVHWPTDIIAGAFVGSIIPIILIQKKIFGFLNKYILQNLVKIEENILARFVKK